MSSIHDLTDESLGPVPPAAATIHGHNFIGSPVLVTYNNGKIEVGLKGKKESSYSYDNLSPDASSWFISLYSNSEAEWHFYEPCNISTKRYDTLLMLGLYGCVFAVVTRNSFRLR